jgi:uncharacterized membrane protein (UPF0127 family)
MENKQTQRLIGQIVLLGVYLFATGLFFWWPDQYDDDTVRLTIGELSYTAEVARTPEARARGLSGRSTFCEDCAMLFVFDTPGKSGFWMKGMQFAIDILWIRDGRIIYKQGNVSPDTRETFIPPEVADSVIEILPNEAVKVGDRVQIEQ